MKKYLIKFILVLYIMLMVTLIASDYSNESAYDQDEFNYSRFPETMKIGLTNEDGKNTNE
jgi:hypothetical protein|tara:strand:+ start:420 stop:599 length:180 start_codon:yes stop_codon:yes gene_type:complete